MAAFRKVLSRPRTAGVGRKRDSRNGGSRLKGVVRVRCFSRDRFFRTRDMTERFAPTCHVYHLPAKPLSTELDRVPYDVDLSSLGAAPADPYANVRRFTVRQQILMAARDLLGPSASRMSLVEVKHLVRAWPLSRRLYFKRRVIRRLDELYGVSKHPQLARGSG
jgi:hypothetical protein